MGWVAVDIALTAANFSLPGSTGGLGPSLQLRDVLRDATLLQQVVARSLLSANSAAKLGDEETGSQGLGKSPTRCLAPFPCQTWILPFDLPDIAWNLDCDPLARQCGRKIGAQGFAITVELDQRQESR